MNWLSKVVGFFLVTLLSIYRSLGTAWLGGACRFEPSCSEYADQAFQIHPPLKALQLSALRVCRCRPGGGFGYDPVPQNSQCRGPHV